METHFHWLCVCVFQVILAYESIVLCKCSGKYIDIYFSLKINIFCLFSFTASLAASWAFAVAPVLPCCGFSGGASLRFSSALPYVSALSYCLDIRRLHLFLFFSSIVPRASGSPSMSPPPRTLFGVFFAPASVRPQLVYLALIWVLLLLSLVFLTRSDLRFPSQRVRIY